MFKPFDIFQVSGDGEPVWVESAATLEDAHQKVLQVAAGQPSEYLIYSHHTGEKILVNVCERNCHA